MTVSALGVHEGDDGQRRAQFVVEVSRAPSSALTFSYATADGTALAGADYVTKLPGSVTFAAGQLLKVVDVRLNSDTSPGVDRDLRLEVTVSGGVPVEELSMVGVAKILDDD